MREVHLKAFEPIPFPQCAPGIVFNANFCRNPMCPTFGPAPDLAACADRYTIRYGLFKGDGSRYRCTICGTISRLLSNRSLRAAYVWFKRQSIPFAACAKEDCAYYGINAFEHQDRYRLDTRKNDYRVRCRRCRSAIDLGEPFRLHRDAADPKTTDRRLTGIFKHVRVGLGMRNSMVLLEDPGVDSKHYQSMLSCLGRQLRDYQSYCNAGLMAPGYLKRLRRLFLNAHDGDAPGPQDSPFNGVATLRTDTMNVSLRTPTAAHAQRQHLLPVLMTALRIHKPRTWFLLAAHPCAVFRGEDMPAKGSQDDIRDARLPLAERRFDHLYHFATPHARTTRKTADRQGGERSRRRDTSYLGAGGLFMRPEYAAVAHFMVLRELTRRFRQVTFCMDGDRTAYRSAAAVFAGDMQTPVELDGKPVRCGKPHARRVEIAVVQARGGAGAPASGGDRNRAWSRQTARVSGNWEAKLKEALEAGGAADLGPEDEARRRAIAKARLFAQPMLGAWSKGGQWGWLLYPPQPGRRMALLWLSQGPEREGPGEVEAFLKYASLQSVDSAIQAMRRRAPAARRPRFRADGLPGYSEASESLRSATSGIWLSWFAMNYARPWTEPQHMPARILGLMRRKDRTGFDIAKQLRIRLDWRCAIEMTEMIGNG